MAFECEGECEGRAAGVAGSARTQVRPLAFEVGAMADDPLPGNSQANGGRCCPHSFNPKIYKPGAANTPDSQALGTDGFAQLTKRRIRTFITRPIARKTNKVAEPP